MRPFSSSLGSWVPRNICATSPIFKLKLHAPRVKFSQFHHFTPLYSISHPFFPLFSPSPPIGPTQSFAFNKPANEKSHPIYWVALRKSELIIDRNYGAPSALPSDRSTWAYSDQIFGPLCGVKWIGRHLNLRKLTPGP